MNKKLIATNHLTQPLKMTSEMIENTWASMEYFLHHLHQDKKNNKKTRMSSLDFEKETISGL